MLVKTWIWVIFEIVIIFILLSLPGSNFHEPSNWFGDFPIDKVVHICLFGSLSFSILIHFETSAYEKLKTVRAHAYVLIFCILYGIGMEYYQKYFVPSRGFDVNDMLADAAGAIMGLPALYQLRKINQRKNRA
jgi:VanZ family protein